MGCPHYRIDEISENGVKVTEISINHFSILQIIDEMNKMLYDGKDVVELTCGTTIIRLKMYYS